MSLVPELALDARTAWVVTGLAYLVMPLAAWQVLRGRYDRDNAMLWCGGAALSGLAILLFGLRDLGPTNVLIFAGNGLNYLGFGARWAALRRERDRHTPLAAVLATSAAGLVLLAVTDLFGEAPRVGANSLFTALLAAAIAHESRVVAREHSSRSAMLIGFSYGLLALVLAVRGVVVSLGLSSTPVLANQADQIAVIGAGMVCALWGNIGYLGFAIESALRRASARDAELAAARARGEQAERQAAELKALSDERQELLRVISHEVRQPLHNAQAVLQGVDREMRGLARTGGGTSERIDRARAVLAQITGGLDNILASSTLLVGDKPTPLRDTEIDMLVDLSLGDLSPAGRARVRVLNDTSIRTAAMDVGLMRLALRNLLTNALVYTPPGTEVVLRVSDSDEPLAVSFEVADSGPGIPPQLLTQLFERGTRGRHDVPGQGLGLYIVKLALRRQGGHVGVYSSPNGTVFTLTVPQGQEP